MALAAFDRVVKEAPEIAEGWNRRANLHYLKGSYEASVCDVQKTLALEPRHFPGPLRRGRAALQAIPGGMITDPEGHVADAIELQDVAS